MGEVVFTGNPECLFSNTPQVAWRPRNFALVECFEGTGRPSNFNLATFGETTGSSDWDYATSPAPLSGAQSLYMQSNAQRFEYAIFGATSPCYTYWKSHILQWNTADHTIMHFDDEDINGLLIIRKNTTTGHARVTDLTDSTNYDSTYDLNEDTTYHFWLDCDADGVVSLYINTSATKPASPIISFTMGTPTVLGVIVLSVEYSGQNIYDNVYVSELPITGDPFATANVYTQSIAGSLPALAGSLVRGTSKALVGSLLIGAGNNTKFITKHPVGSVSLATGSAIKKSIRTLSGALPAQTGVIVKRAGKSLLGYVPFQSGVIVKGTNKIVLGSVPAQDGDIVKDIARMLSGNVPALSGSAVKKTSKTTQGTIPSASGLLAKMTAKVLSGSLPYSVGSIVKSTLKSLSGNFPAQEGDPGIGTMFNEVLAGIVPAITGGVAKLTSEVWQVYFRL